MKKLIFIFCILFLNLNNSLAIHDCRWLKNIESINQLKAIIKNTYSEKYIEEKLDLEKNPEMANYVIDYSKIIFGPIYDIDNVSKNKGLFLIPFFVKNEMIGEIVVQADLYSHDDIFYSEDDCYNYFCSETSFKTINLTINKDPFRIPYIFIHKDYYVDKSTPIRYDIFNIFNLDNYLTKRIISEEVKIKKNILINEINKQTNSPIFKNISTEYEKN